MISRDTNASRKAIDYSKNRCVVCGWNKTTRNGNPLVEGAHIKPFCNDNSADVFCNIIALCPNHHTQFDRYLFYIDCETRKTVFFDTNDEYHDIDISNNIYYVEKKYLAYRQYLYNKENGDNHE